MLLVMGVSLLCKAACSISGQSQWLESIPYTELKSLSMRLTFLCFLELPRNESSILILSTFKDNYGTPGETELGWGQDPGGLISLQCSVSVILEVTRDSHLQFR